MKGNERVRRGGRGKERMPGEGVAGGRRGRAGRRV